MSPRITNMAYLVCGIGFALPSLFFAYYSVRLGYVYLTATTAETAAHSMTGMLIGAIAFPVAAIFFGLVSRLLIKKALVVSTIVELNTGDEK